MYKALIKHEKQHIKCVYQYLINNTGIIKDMYFQNSNERQHVS